MPPLRRSNRSVIDPILRRTLRELTRNGGPIRERTSVNSREIRLKVVGQLLDGGREFVGGSFKGAVCLIALCLKFHMAGSPFLSSRLKFIVCFIQLFGDFGKVRTSSGEFCKGVGSFRIRAQSQTITI